MAGYQHVLVAVDLSEESALLLNKARERAEIERAKLSIIHIDINLNELYTGMLDIDMEAVKARLQQTTLEKIEKLTAAIDYPIEKRLAVCGDLPDKINEAVRLYAIDLLVCGHHHSFWHLFTSSARQLMNTAPCDLLIVPLLEKPQNN